MASRLLTLDASRGSVVVSCSACGWSIALGTRADAEAAADHHRARVHPRQATYVESKRRARARVRT